MATSSRRTSVEDEDEEGNSSDHIGGVLDDDDDAIMRDVTDISNNSVIELDDDKEDPEAELSMSHICFSVCMY